MPDVNTQKIIDNIHQMMPLIVANALNVLGALVILLVGLWLSGKCNRLVVQMLGRAPHFDEMLKNFFGSLARYLVLTVTVLAVLSEFGIQTTSFVAVLGAAGLAIGLALQGILSNLAAGVMLLIFRPFRIRDQVQVAGSVGTVKDLSLFWTELIIEGNVQLIVPNSGVWGQPIKNFSTYPKPPGSGELRVRIAETADLNAALAQVRALIDADSRILKDPAPSILLDRAVADNALEIVAGFSTNGAKPEEIKSDLIRALCGGIENKATP